MRSATNQALPGMVCSQLLSWPLGGLGEKYASMEPSALVFMPSFIL